MLDVAEWVRSADSALSTAGIEAPRLEAQLLAAHVLGVERGWVLAHPEEPFNELAGEALLQRRLAGEPLAYILGWREFYGRRFRVNRHVLIPRQETELLVDWALAYVPEGGRVLEVGVGSGCIAVSLVAERPDLEVVGTDLSAEAIEIAQTNAELLLPEGPRPRFIQTDLASGLEGPFDLVLSNPPYVEETADLPIDVRQEPALALFAGPDGLDIYRRLAIELIPLVPPGGFAAFEHGQGQGDAICDLFTETGAWQARSILADLAGIERVQTFDRTRNS